MREISEIPDKDTCINFVFLNKNKFSFSDKKWNVTEKNRTFILILLGYYINWPIYGSDTSNIISSIF